jgi:hypothetical protein
MKEFMNVFVCSLGRGCATRHMVRVPLRYVEQSATLCAMRRDLY